MADLDAADADVGVDEEGRRPRAARGALVVPVDVDAAAVAVEDVARRPCRASAVVRDADVLGDEHDLASPDRRPPRRRAVALGELDVAQVDDQLPDADS